MPRTTPHIFAAALAALALVAPAAALELDVSGNGSVGPEDLALVEDALFTDDPAADVDGNGRVDFRDAALVKQGMLPVVEFEFLGTTVAEDAGSIAVALRSDRSFDGGVVYFDVRGTAADGADYQVLAAGSTVISGDTAVVAVEIVDDAQLDPVEWVELSLVRGAGYRLGAFSEHSIRIEDNDSVWHGSFVPDEGEAASTVAFVLEVVRSGASVSGTLSGAGGLIPELAPPAPLDTVSFDEASFAAAVSGIALPLESARDPASATRTLGRAAMQLALELDPGAITTNPVCPDEDTVHCVDPSATEPVEVVGTATLTLASPDAPHLDRAIAGQYALYREPIEPSPAELPLADVEN